MTNLPINDPTTLTTEQIRHELSQLREVFETRLNAIDRAIALAHEDAVRVPTDIQQAIGHLRELIDEKFNTVDIQFQERDKRDVQSRTDNTLTINAALAAQEKAVNKQNETFERAIEKSENSTANQFNAVNSKIDDVKDRFIRSEGTSEGSGASQQQSRSQSNWTVTTIISGLAFMVALTGIILAVLGH